MTSTAQPDGPTSARCGAMASAALRRATHAVVSVTRDWEIVNASSTLYRMCPTAGPVEGFDLWSTLAADWTDRSVEELVEILDRGDPHAQMTLHRAADPDCGTWLDVIARPSPPESGHGFDVVLRDVTEWITTAEELRSEQARREAIVAHTSDAILFFQPDCTIEWASPATARLFGISPEELVGLNGVELIHPDDRDRAFLTFLSMDEPGSEARLEFRYTAVDGTVRWIEEVATNLIDDPNVGLVVGTLRDVTERHRTSEWIELQARLLDAVGQAVVAMGTDGRVVYWNDAATDLYGWTKDEALNAPVSALVRPSQGWEQVALSSMTAAQSGQPWTGEFWVERRDGSSIPILVTDTPVYDADGRLTAVLGISSDISDRIATQAEIEHRSLHDPLTGLPNRHLLLRRLAEELCPAQRPDRPIAIAFLDIDRFNVVNDSLGHLVGDRVLEAVGARLAGSARSDDTVARLGGDEFVVLRPGCDEGDALEFADHVRRAVDEPLEIDGREFFLTASVGVCTARPGDDPDTLLANADAAMYAAKELGRDRVELFDDELRRRSELRLELATDLRWAVEREELRVVYQPIVSLDDGALRGVEALVRWQHPTRGLMSPAEFIPVAEATGLIAPIGEWVLRTAARQLAAWRHADRRLSDLWVSVNLSGRQLDRPDLVDTAHRIVSECGLRPGSIHLEVTESVLMDGSGPWFPTVRSLRSLGFHISVDDFGTGYSSLSYLKELPVDTLKIDRSFVSGLAADPRDRSIVKSVLELASVLGLDVVAEGVEDARQAEILHGLGCPLGQGYLWGRPESAATFDPAHWRRTAADTPVG